MPDTSAPPPDDVDPGPPRAPAADFPGGPRRDGRARPVTIVGTPVLHTPARRVVAFDEDLAVLVDDMFTTMEVAQGVGLAAPQVGDDRAVFVYDCPDDEGVRHVGHVVNPEVVAVSDEDLEEMDEGCLSVPGPYLPLVRPFTATVRGVDRTGAPVEVTGSGFFGRCLQHEHDHLQGRLYLDLLRVRQRRRAIREIEPQDWNAPLPTP